MFFRSPHARCYTCRLLRWPTLIVLSMSLAAGSVMAADLAPLRVNVFPGAQNLAIYAGLAHGIFEKHGLKVDLQFTPNSNAQRTGLAEGKFEIAHAAVDNAVHMVEVAKKDVVIVMGGDSSMNEFFVQADISTFEDLRGKVLAVDAPNTAYALLARKILQNNGLSKGDYTVKPVGGTAVRMRALLEDKSNAAAILNIPFSIVAKQKGLKSLGRSVDLLGPYQATGAFVMREWAGANGPVLERYIAAYVESLRWVLNPENRAPSAGLLVKWLKVPQDVADQTYDLVREPKFGLNPDAKFDLDGFKQLLALRAEMEGQWGGTPPAPDRFFDLGYYERAMKQLAR